jgi:hypothetical protein
LGFAAPGPATAADLVLIPLRPSILDIYSVEGTAAVVKATSIPLLLVLNACAPPTIAGESGTTAEARTALEWGFVPRRRRWPSAWISRGR